jgi:RNA polymerase sigma-70 factor (ECF subfamily)
VTDIAWIDAALTSARPQAISALLRYFHDLDTAEEAFQEASLRALRNWPRNGPPRDPAAWLIFVARNSGIDTVRRRGKEQELPDDALLSNMEDAEAELAERLDAVAATIYLMFNEGYSASGSEKVARAPLCDEAIRLARLLLRLFQGEPAVMGLLALLLLQHARAPARFDADGFIVLLEDQDRSLWNREMIAEGLALIEKAARHDRPEPYLVQASIAAQHARAARAADTDWAQIDFLYGALERLQPSPVVTLNRAVAVAKVSGPAAALAMIEPLAPRLSGYFHFFGLRGALLMQLGRDEEARVALGRAIGLANTAAEAAHIRQHLDRLVKDSATK